MNHGLGSCNCCGSDAVATYPLLPGSPSFCGAHHNASDAGRFGCDFSGPDDFDIPGGSEIFDETDLVDILLSGPVWVDKDGNEYQTADEIKDDHLYNIVMFLERRLDSVMEESNDAESWVVDYLTLKHKMMREYAVARNLISDAEPF